MTVERKSDSMRPRRKLAGLSASEKRWRALPKRLLWGLMARIPGAPSRFRRALGRAVAAKPSETLRYAVPFVLAERVLGDTAIIDADPRSIDRWLISEAKSAGQIESPRDHFLIDGSWKPLTRALDSSQLDNEVREFIACLGDYRQMPLFRRSLKRLRDEGSFVRNGIVFRTADDIDAYCRHHVNLIESIRKHGVVRRADLGKIGASAGRATPNSAFLERTETDAGVAVGPNGRLLRYRGGFHRTAAARELGLANMPVQVKLVHLTWLREVVEETGLAPCDALLEGLKRLSVPVQHP
jgi:hypothetical protein